MLYKSLFVAKLTYCVPLWGSCPKTLLTRLWLLQKKCLRVILGIPHCGHVTIEFRKHQLFSIFQLYVYHVLLLAKNSLLYDRFNSIFKRRESSLVRVFRTFQVPLMRTSFYQSSFRFQAVKLYNALPADMQLCASLYVFKNFLRTYVFTVIPIIPC